MANPSFPAEFRKSVQENLDAEPALRKAHDLVMQDERVVRYLQVKPAMGPLPGHNQELMEAASKISIQEREIYRLIYKQSNRKGAGPCADFHF